MPSNGTFNGLQGWSNEVAVIDTNSIMNTSHAVALPDRRRV